MSKILVLANLGSDYGEAMFYKGLVELLGPDRVICWPFKNTYHGKADHYPERSVNGTHYFDSGKSWSEKWTDRALYRAWLPERHPAIPTSNDGPLSWMPPQPTYPWKYETIVDLLQKGEIPLVVMGAVRWHSSIAWCELREALANGPFPPLVLLDNEDYYQLRWDFVHEYRPLVMFKRTLVLEGNPRSDIENNDVKVPIYPMPFSTLWPDLPWVPWEEREWDIFCVFGATQVLRQKVKDTVLAVASEFPRLRVMAQVGHPMGHEEYMRTLGRSKIVIDHQRMGTDTVRFWEATSAGACVLSDLHLPIEPALVPGVHYAQYDRDMSWQGDQQVFDRFKIVLRDLLANTDRAHAIARAGYDAVRTQHRNVDRARYVLEKARAHGVDLKGLL